MPHTIHNYLRAHRKRAGLSQDELASLLGCQSGTKVSRYERQTRTPVLSTALACQVIFQVPVHELFPGLYEEVEHLTRERARTLMERLQSAPRTPLPEHKRNWIEAIATPPAIRIRYERHDG